MPSLMANMFTAAFVSPINQCYKQLKNDTACKNNCDKMASLVLKSIIHKSVKVLDCILTLPIELYLIIIKLETVM